MRIAQRFIILFFLATACRESFEDAPSFGSSRKSFAPVEDANFRGSKTIKGGIRVPNPTDIPTEVGSGIAPEAVEAALPDIQGVEGNRDQTNIQRVITANKTSPVVNDIIKQGLKLAVASGRVAGIETEFGLSNSEDLRNLASSVQGNFNYAPEPFYGAISKSSLGLLAVKREGITNRPPRHGFEVVSQPLNYRQTRPFQRMFNGLQNIGAQGVSDNWGTGIHVNIDASGLNAPEIRKLLLWWDRNRDGIIAEFKPSEIRATPDGKPYYGPHSHDFIADLEALSDTNVTNSQLLDLYRKHYPDIWDVNWGKHFDINPLDSLYAGRSRRLEFRIFNGEFGSNAKSPYAKAIAFALSVTELAAQGKLP